MATAPAASPYTDSPSRMSSTPDSGTRVVALWAWQILERMTMAPSSSSHLLRHRSCRIRTRFLERSPATPSTTCSSWRMALLTTRKDRCTHIASFLRKSSRTHSMISFLVFSPNLPRRVKRLRRSDKESSKTYVLNRKPNC